MNTNTMFQISLLTFLLAGSFAVKANSSIEQCQAKRNNNINYLQCLDSKIELAERELSTYINARKLELEELQQNQGRGDALKAFLRSQQNFEQYKQDNCRWRYLKLLPDSTAAAIRYKECEIIHTFRRIEDLQRID